jgi:Rrf2 family protein
MIKMNKKVEYALMVLKHLRNHQTHDLTTAREISDLYQIPFDTTAKVMQQLNTAGWLISLKGVKGGYCLAQDLNQVTLVDVVELIEQKSFGTTCEHGPCELIETCNITTPYKKIHEYIEMMFRTIPLEQILEDQHIKLKNLTKMVTA